MRGVRSVFSTEQSIELDLVDPVFTEVIRPGRSALLQQPGWNITLAVQHTPDVDVVRLLDIEYEKGVALYCP